VALVAFLEAEVDQVIPAHRPTTTAGVRPGRSLNGEIARLG
jgi:hypothetical protein